MFRRHRGNLIHIVYPCVAHSKRTRIYSGIAASLQNDENLLNNALVLRKQGRVFHSKAIFFFLAADSGAKKIAPCNANPQAAFTRAVYKKSKRNRGEPFSRCCVVASGLHSRLLRVHSMKIFV